MIPMVQFLVTILSNQTASLALDFFRSGEDKIKGLSGILKQEFTLSFFMGTLLSFISLSIFILLRIENEIYYLFSLSFLMLVISSVLLSVFIPWTFKQFSRELNASIIPLSVILANILSILILSLFAYL
jgi:Mg/Co/Ni transporter MgtE